MAMKYGDFSFDCSQGFTGSAGKKQVRGYMRGGSVRPKLVDEVRDIKYSEVAHTRKTPIGNGSRDAAFCWGGKVKKAKGGKVQKVMHEFKAGELHSGSKKGPVVKSRKQAIAIALSEAKKGKK